MPIPFKIAIISTMVFGILFWLIRKRIVGNNKKYEVFWGAGMVTIGVIAFISLAWGIIANL